MNADAKQCGRLLAAMILVSPCWSEESAANTETQGKGARVIEEVVVTATKRSENLREIAASIAAFSGDDLEARGAQDTADIIKLVPGANLTSTGDSPARVTIRGISSDIGTSSTTGILFGNVSFSDTYVPFVALDPNPFDMQSVEVLKGPQGTLYGASALNGAVRYVPEKPTFDASSFKWFAQQTSIKGGGKEPTYGAALNMPLIEDKLAMRIMGFDRTAPGFVDNLQMGVKDVNEIEQTGGRVLLAIEPTDDWSVLFMHARQDTLQKDVGIVDSENGELVTNNRPRHSPKDTHYHINNLFVGYTWRWADFIYDGSYVEKEGDNFFDASSRVSGNGDRALDAQVYTGFSETKAHEFRIASNDQFNGNFKWTIGYFDWQQDILTTLAVPVAFGVPLPEDVLALLPSLQSSSSDLFTPEGNPIVIASAADVLVEETAFFGEVSYRVLDNLELAIGGRKYKTTSGGDNRQSGVFVLSQRGEPDYTLSGEVEEEGFNPKYSVVWNVTDDILTYALASKGFRVGGVQFGVTTPLSQTPAPDTFKSDTLWNYELGIRTQWFNNTLRFDVTGYKVDWEEPQSLQPDASGLAVYIDNVGGVESKGYDVALQYLFPWWGLMLTSSMSYAKTVTTEDFTISNGSVIPAGSRWPLAPERQSATTLSFQQFFGSWAVGGYATYTSIGDAIPFFTGMKIFDYHQVDLQLNLSNDTFEWLPKISLIANNVTDERGTTNAFTSGVPTPEAASKEFYYITPKSLTLRLSGSF